MVETTDYIIVGAGSAGCILANRLSDDSTVKVTLVEAGGWDDSIFVTMPAGVFQLIKTHKFDWGYNSVPQKHLADGRKLHLPRGKVIGGSGSVNAMVYVRGDCSDFDHWGQLGNRGWSYDGCLPYFKKTESFEGGGSDARGREGPLKVTRNGILHPLAKTFVKACEQYGLPYNDDFNSGLAQDGVGPTDSNIFRGRRCSSAVAYLRPALKRANLGVITKALTTRVLMKDGRAVGIEYVKGHQKFTIQARKEVILAAGAVNSPQLLQLSGIGDGNLLQQVGIPVLHELKGVGKNLQDHPSFAVKQRCIQPVTYFPMAKPLNGLMALARYALFKTGPAASTGLQTMAFVRTTRDAIAPDLQLSMQLLVYWDSGRQVLMDHGYQIYFNLQRPESRGSLEITSPDPTAAPRIDPNYFESYNDLKTMREGVKLARAILAQKAFDPYRGPEYGPGADVKTDEEIENHIRGIVDSNYHLSGTCKMGSDDNAVVDDQLRVRGIDGLRVIDASIMPTIVSGNTNAATMMIAEKGSDLVLGKSR